MNNEDLGIFFHFFTIFSEGSVVHVRNLSTRTTEYKLRGYFEKHGKIEDINIVKERDTG